MAIQAIRFTFADSDEVFDDALKPILIKMLDIMLIDPNIENRRLALGTLNSATHNKPEIILPNIGSLIPLVIKASRADPDLIREVQMGPFKHKVDDGLELRKVHSHFFDMSSVCRWRHTLIVYYRALTKHCTPSSNLHTAV